jgi:hypothetical protein
MNGTMGTKASAGWNRPRYSAAQRQRAWTQNERPETVHSAPPEPQRQDDCYRHQHGQRDKRDGA